MINIIEKKKITNDVIKHIDNSLPTKALDILNGYTIALEGWRRGLNLTMRLGTDLRKRTRKLTFILDDGEGTSYEFNSASTSKTTNEAKLTCMKKEKTKATFSQYNVSQAEGKSFTQDTYLEDMITYANEIGYPVVVKPNDGYGGKGITTNIKNDLQLKSALIEVESILNNKTQIIIEKHYTGYDYRLYVIEDEVIASALRIPANIIGDGKNTIGDLIIAKNKLRVKNKGPSNRSIINLDEELKNTLESARLTLDSIMPKGELLFIKQKANVSSGGESIDVTDEMRTEYKQIAIDAVKSIEGLYIGAVDLLIDDDKGTAIVLEINTKPGLDIQMYPTFGKARDIPEKLIDYLFPKSIDNKVENSKRMYFDFNSVFEMTYHKSIFDTVTIPKIPKFVALSKHKITIPKDKHKNFMFYLRMMAHRYRVSGSITEHEDHLVLVTGASQRSTREIKQVVEDKLVSYNEPYKVEEMIRTLPVKQGFELIRQGYK